MEYIWVKLKDKTKNIYRTIDSTVASVFNLFPPELEQLTPFSNNILLGDNGWFYIEVFNERFHRKVGDLPPASIEVEAEKNNIWEQIMQETSTANYNILDKSEVNKVGSLFVTRDRYTFFQRVRRTKQVKWRGIQCINGKFVFQETSEIINIKENPDAVYDRFAHRLYFNNFEMIVGAFPGVEQLRRKADPEEIKRFLENDLIPMQGGLTADDVKTANKRRIATAAKILERVKSEKKENEMLAYLKEYWPTEKIENNRFIVSSDKELKDLLYGLEERYYKTSVFKEKRLANSVTPL